MGFGIFVVFPLLWNAILSYSGYNCKYKDARKYKYSSCYLIKRVLGLEELSV